jgi:endonuclease III
MASVSATASERQAGTDAKAATKSPARRAKKVAAQNLKEEPESSDLDDAQIKQEETTPRKPTARAAAPTPSTTRSRKRTSSATDSTPAKRGSKRTKTEVSVKNEDIKQLPSPSASSASPSPGTPATKPTKSTKSTPQSLRDRKLKAHTAYAGAKLSPFPDFPHPTPAEAKLAHKILSSLHGSRTRPTEVVAPSSRAGCGDSPSVLDALVRTILSQNTSDSNSTRAKRSMDTVYGGSDNWDAIVKGGQGKLQEAIKCGGLSVVKSRVIISILNQVYEKYGKYSLDHLHETPTEDAMTELISFQGVGPKTASCVLLFCLQREDFAVDTHVYRITGLLGWRPQKANREETYAHLNVRVPDEDKYGLHILLVGHGKKCDECKAGGRNVGKCELRKAFRKGKVEEGIVKDEEEAAEAENVKAEEEEDDD